MKILRRTVLVALLSLTASRAWAGDGQHEKAGFGSLKVEEVAKLVADKTVAVFDNNSKDRFEKGHVPGAKWVQFNEVKESDLPKDKAEKLVFYCANSH